MSEDIVRLETELSLQEINERLGYAKTALNACVENAEPDPLSYIVPSIAVRFSGKNMGIGPREWCVVIYVTDNGYSREIELRAIGDGISSKISSGFSMYRGEKAAFYQMKDSIRRRDRIIAAITG